MRKINQCTHRFIHEKETANSATFIPRAFKRHFSKEVDSLYFKETEVQQNTHFTFDIWKAQIPFLKTNDNGTHTAYFTSVGPVLKRQAIQKIAFATWLAKQNGIEIVKSFVFSPQTKGPTQSYSIQQRDITKRVEEVRKDVIRAAVRAAERFKQKKNRIHRGLHCNKPVRCPLLESCYNLPKGSFHLFDLSATPKTVIDEALQSALYFPLEWPEEWITPEIKKQLDVIKSDKPKVNVQAMKNFGKSLTFPALVVDVEMFSPPKPLHLSNTKPFERVPFLICFGLIDKDGKVLKSGHGYLDPNQPSFEALAKPLVKAAENTKQVIAFDKKSELEAFEYLKQHAPTYRKSLEEIMERTVDIAVPFKKGYFLHPAMNGSTSLKNLLRALGSTYTYEEGLVANGFQASVSYENLWYAEGDTPNADAMRDELIGYCMKDALGLKDVVACFLHYLED